MTITQEQIIKLSKNLAKLHPNNEEKLASSMNSILDYVNLLNEVNTSWINPTISVITKKWSHLKEDINQRDITPAQLLKCSKQKVIANQIAVSDIMK